MFQRFVAFISQQLGLLIMLHKTILRLAFPGETNLPSSDRKFSHRKG